MQRSHSTYSSTLNVSGISYEPDLEKNSVCLKLQNIYVYILILPTPPNVKFCLSTAGTGSQWLYNFYHNWDY